MRKSALLLMLPITVIGGLGPMRSREQPPPAHTGGFGEPTCALCHMGEPLNEPSGQLALLGLPDSFAAGREYALTVRLTRPGLVIGGFELAARFENGARAGKQAGRLAGLDRRVLISDTNRIQYAHHSLVGSTARNDTIHWRLRWRAPASAARVVFHVAANASGDDASPLGDHIYTLAVRTSGRTRKY